MKCANCGKTIELLPFTCNCCGKRYCLECRTPDDHTCHPHKKNWSAFLDNRLMAMEQERADFTAVEPEDFIRPEEFDELR
jgi:predicted nucleic acid binding AN1-type Zn finger protein